MTAFMAGSPALKDLYGDLKRRMDHAVAAFQANLASTRTGRASVHMLDQIKVDYYGTLTPINQMAQVSAPEPQLITSRPGTPASSRRLKKRSRLPILASIPSRMAKSFAFLCRP